MRTTQDHQPGNGNLQGRESRVLVDPGISFLDHLPDFSLSEDHHYRHHTFLNDLSAGSVQLHYPGEIIPYSCSMEGYSPVLEKGQSRDHAPDHSSEKRISDDEIIRQQKRKRCSESHNLNERLRRQRIKEKMKALQELIPNCHKRDKESTLDDAIKHIKTLQYQLQMISMAAGFSMLHHPPPMMMPQPTAQQPGLQIPSFPPSLHTVPQARHKMEIANVYCPSTFSQSQVGLPNPHRFTSGGSVELLQPKKLNPAKIQEMLSTTASQGTPTEQQCPSG